MWHGRLLVLQVIAWVVRLQALVLRDPQLNSLRQVEQHKYATCSRLKNRISHFTVEIGVGTPLQKFDVVADTGSFSVIVQSCLCKKITDECTESEKCFTGKNQSSTFIGPEENTSLLKLSFGSGDIFAVRATDVVSVGGVSTTMERGVLLMVKRQLAINQDFEGILGLGVPSWANKTHGKFMLPRFLEDADIDTFSICFKPDQDGALRLNPPPVAGMLKQVGANHWSLRLEGFSVGGSSMPAIACNPATKKTDSVSPCAAIPDSGTTHILGPQTEIDQIFADICGRWPRCEQLKSQQQITPQIAFKHALFVCQDWLTEEQGLAEVPSIFIHLMAEDGATQVLELTPMSYVYATVTLEGRTACYPSFDAWNYDTQRHGPAWILGTPLFYEYHVNFGLRPPTLGFSKASCELCDGQVHPGFMNATQARSFNRPRIMSGKPRFPDIDVNDEL